MVHGTIVTDCIHSLGNLASGLDGLTNTRQGLSLIWRKFFVCRTMAGVLGLKERPEELTLDSLNR